MHLASVPTGRCSHPECEIPEWFCMRNANADNIDDIFAGCTALTISVSFDKIESVKKLLELGADTHGWGDKRLPSYNLIKLLLEAGADPNDGMVLNRHKINDTDSIFRLLVDYGADTPRWAWAEELKDRREYLKKQIASVLLLRASLRDARDILSTVGKHLWSMRWMRGRHQ